MRKRDNQRLGRRGVLVVVVLLGALAGWIAIGRLGRAKPARDEGVTAAIPSGAIVVAVLDLAALRSHPLTRGFLREPRSVEGIGDLAQACGADPLELVDRLAVAVPARTDVGFGVFAQGALDAKTLSRCAETIVARRGGQPIRESRDGFIVVRDGAAGATGAALALRERGPLLLAEPAYLAAALKTVRGQEPGVVDDPAHRKLRASVGEATIVATVVLSSEQRASLGDELERPGIKASPIAAVRGGALAIRLEDQLYGHAIIACDGTGACATIAEALRAELAAKARAPLARVLGYAPLLERLMIEPRGDELHLRAAMPVADAVAIVRRLLALRQLAAQPQPSAAPPAPPTNDPAQRR
jgi:hypothetical protein